MTCNTSTSWHARPLDCFCFCDLPAHISISCTHCSGFDRALVQLDDLVLDNPHAHEAMGKFMARAVADEIICPKYVTSRPAPGDSDEAVRAFAKGRGLVASPQGLQRLEHVWGTNGGLSPVDELRDKVHQLLEEYLETRNLEEAVACVRELHAPHFHHEVVFQVIGLAIDGRDERDMLALSALLKAACGEALISLVQLEKGLSRIFESISDIELDCPKATLNLDSFCHLSSAFLPRAACHRAAKIAKITMVRTQRLVFVSRYCFCFELSTNTFVHSPPCLSTSAIPPCSLVCTEQGQGQTSAVRNYAHRVRQKCRITGTLRSSTTDAAIGFCNGWLDVVDMQQNFLLSCEFVSSSYAHTSVYFLEHVLFESRNKSFFSSSDCVVYKII